MLGALLALSATSVGYLVCSGLGLRRSLAPVVGLASIAVVSSWSVALGLPPAVMTSVVGLGVLGGALLAVRRRRRLAARLGWPAALLGAGVLAPGVLLGVAFAGQPVPVSNHDGAYHVETIDALRHGIPVETWYPHGYHATLTAVLGFAPWVDTARGTLEASHGLAILAPAAAFGLASAFGLPPLAAGLGALVLGLSFVYPYDYQLWGGWPLGMNIVLVLGLWSIAIEWLRRPDARRALLGGFFGGAIVLTHGTEVYTGVVGLLVLLLASLRRVEWVRLGRQLPLAGVLALLIAAPYLPTLLGWAHAGGATSSGREILEYAAAHPDIEGRFDVLQFGLGAVGAAAELDLPLRLAVVLAGVGLACARRQQRILVTGWLTFLAIVFGVDFLDLPWLNRVFVVTYPWLVDHRLRQVAVVFASLLSGYALFGGVELLRHLRRRLATRPQTWRRLAIACAVLAGFFAEGSAVSIYKRLDQAVVESVYSNDDRAAMTWLRENARPGEMVVNAAAADAGIWTPYVADVPVLLPRSFEGPDRPAREAIVRQLTDLEAPPAPASVAEACRLHLAYVLRGARVFGSDESVVPAAGILERAPGLEEAFRSGDAAVFRTRLDCP
jgi:hypothetical protein